jgi:hypothetical protein
MIDADVEKWRMHLSRFFRLWFNRLSTAEPVPVAEILAEVIVGRMGRADRGRPLAGSGWRNPSATRAGSDGFREELNPS